MPSPFIHKLVFEIGLDCPENEAKATSDMLFNKHIALALERVLTRFNKEDIRIDTPIEIDLGNISEEDLLYNLENALIKELQKYARGTVAPTSHTLRRTSISELFFSYIQFPLIPWDITELEDFDIEHISQKAVEEIVVSDKLTEKLIALISDKPETFNRFFDLTFRLDTFPDLLKKIVSKLPNNNATIYREFIDSISSEESGNKLFFKNITRYLLYNLLYNKNRGTEKNLIFINALLPNREAPLEHTQLKADAELKIFTEDKRKLLALFIEQILHTTTLSSYNFSRLEAITSFLETIDSKEATLILKTLEELERSHSNETEEQRRKLFIRLIEQILHTATQPPYNFSRLEAVTSFRETIDSKEATLILKTLEELERKNHSNETEEQKRELLTLLIKQIINATSQSTYNRPATIATILAALRAKDANNLLKIVGLLEKNSQSSELVTEETPDDISDESKAVPKSRKEPLKTDSEKERDKKEKQPIESDKLSSEELSLLKKAVDLLLHTKEADKEKSFTSKLDKEIETIFRKQPEVNERIPVYNAGLVLYQPFLISFFDNLGLLENRERFISIEHQIRAVHLLHHLSGFDTKADEHFLLFNKMLCGVNILFPISSEFIITEQEKTEVEKLTKALIRNWEIIKNTSVRGFQESFVKRKGVLERSQNDWILRVETKGIDILLDDIPWNIHLIAFPWNEYFIHVDWSL